MTDDPHQLAEINVRVNEFMLAARRQAGEGYRIRPGMRCRVKPGTRGVPAGLYTIDAHFVSRYRSNYGVVNLTAAALKVTPKTPRFPHVDVGRIEVRPDMGAAFDADGWRVVNKFLHVAGIMGRAAESRSTILWGVIADALQDNWYELGESAAYEPGCRWAGLAGYPADSAELIGRIMRGAAFFPMYGAAPEPSPEAARHNWHPEEPK